ncbi:MAG TPA: hypothetical protein VJZ76_20300 [Thermoanaerobaculia bacterium]|nr:hypothetical protein [Thermoanaerobaculia bacterium]
MRRAVSLFVAAIFIAMPLLPVPQVCYMRSAAKMHPCCKSTTQAPVKAVTIRVDVAPAAAAPRIHVAAPASRTLFAQAVQRTSFWQPLATIQLRI